MDPRSKHPSLLAPGASASTPVYCPRPGPPRPRLDDHIAPVEDDERIEIIHGERVSAMAGAGPAHSQPQARLAAVLVAVAAPGHAAHVELLTRHDLEDDFVTDASILKEGTDPRTGDRYLEELAFEVANEQSLGKLRQKAKIVSERGVRRVFGILVKKGIVLEWRKDLDDFTILGTDQEITDPCLRMPLKVRALLDGAAAELQMVEALLRRDDGDVRELALRVLREKGVLKELEERAHEEGHKEGREEGLRAAIGDICELLGIELTTARRAQVQALGVEGLEELRLRLRQERAWP